jgi:pyruvate kinase
MHRATKIIATIGPACSSDERTAQLVHAGVDVFRLNFSHGTHVLHGDAIRRIRQAAQAAGRIVAIMQDLSGPKIRTGLLRDHQPIDLQAGEALTIAVGDFVGAAGRVSTTYAALPTVVKAGDALLLDDGRIQLRVEDTSSTEIRTVVVDPGPLGENKGINAPGAMFPSGQLTEKDARDLAFGVEAGVAGAPSSSFPADGGDSLGGVPVVSVGVVAPTVVSVGVVSFGVLSVGVVSVGVVPVGVLSVGVVSVGVVSVVVPSRQ